MVKFVGKKAVVVGKGSCLFLFNNGGKSSSLGNSSGLARLTVNDFTMNCPPNLRPFTSLLGLNEKSDAGPDDLVV